MPYGWVRTDDETNEAYLATVPTDDPWWQLIFDAHEQLARLDPEYEITQIKEKFGALRYYFHSDLFQQIPEIMSKMSAVVNDAERQSYEISQRS